MRAAWAEAVERLLPGGPCAGAVRAMIICRPLAAARSVLFFVFDEDDADPSWTLRGHRDPAVAEREALVLSELRRRGCRFQPEIVGSGRCEDLHALLLRFCAGRHADAALWRQGDVVDQVASALAEMQKALSGWAESAFAAGAADAGDVVELCDNVGRACERLGRDTAFAGALAAAHTALARTATALPQHGDCSTSNLLWDYGNLRILDWEHFGCCFEPFLDIWTFALSVCAEAGDPDATSLYGPGVNAEMAERAVRCYAARIGLPAEIGRDVFPLIVSRVVQLNAALGRTIVVQRMCRVLQMYLGDSANFMRGLR